MSSAMLPDPAQVPRPDTITVPKGASLPLVLETAISSATSRLGEPVVAKVAEDVKVGEKVVVPAGTEVRGLVTAAVPSGRGKGPARLGFDFDALVLDAEAHSIGTRPVDIAVNDRLESGAAIIRIGVGAIDGGIVAGKGAGIGGLIGATGTGVVLTNQDDELELGSGSRMTVRLTRDACL